MANELDTVLYDTWSADPVRTSCRIAYGDSSIYIRPEGHGDCGSRDGHGWPVMIERYNGDIRIVVWADINQENPTHIIDLAGALESNRKEKSP